MENLELMQIVNENLVKLKEALAKTKLQRDEAVKILEEVLTLGCGEMSDCRNCIEGELRKQIKAVIERCK